MDHRDAIKTSVAVAIGASAVYAFVATVLLDPETLFSVDAAVKLLQARALVQQHWLALPYPSAHLDPRGEFCPFVTPFVFQVGGRWEGIFSSAIALFNAGALRLGDRGVVLASAVAGGVTVGAVTAVPTNAPRWFAPVLLGAGTCLWFYGVVAWEHAPAVALSTVAWVVLTRSVSPRAIVAAGLALGIGALLREELLLLVPGFLWIVWRGRRSIPACAALVILVVLPAGALAILDVSVFERPPAAHLAYAVEFIGTRLADWPSIPRRPSLSATERYETVVHLWLLGRQGIAYSMMLILVVLLAALNRRRRTVVFAAIVLALLQALQVPQDLLSAGTQLEFPSGLLRLSPALIFALLPVAPDQRSSPARTDALVICAAYGLGLIAAVSLSGGASFGPRLVLPIVPMLAMAACEGISSYRLSLIGPPAIAAWSLGALLLVASIAVQVACGAWPYVTFNRAERLAVRQLREAPEQVVVLDSAFTLSVAEPVYHSKQVLRADNEIRGAQLAQLLAKTNVHSFLLVSREATQIVDFAPFHIAAVYRFPKTTIQRWELR
jgi:hypothetical protein